MLDSNQSPYVIFDSNGDDGGLLDKIPDDQLKSNKSKKRPLFGLTLHIDIIWVVTHP